MLTIREKDINRTKVSPIKDARNRTICTPPPFPKQIQEVHEPCLFSPVSSSPVTTIKISKSPQVRFIIAWSNLSCFIVHISLQLQTGAYKLHAPAIYLHPFFTAPPIGDIFGIQSKICGEAFFWKKSTLLTIAWRRFDGKYSTTGVKQGNLGLPLPANSPNLHQIQKKARWNLGLTLRPLSISLFLGVVDNISRSIWRHFPGCLMKFAKIFDEIFRNIWGHYPECLATFPGMFSDIPRNITFSPFQAFRFQFLCSCFYT